MTEARVFSGTWLYPCLILLSYQLKKHRREALVKLSSVAVMNEPRTRA